MEKDMLNLFSTATKISYTYTRCMGSAYLTMGGTPLNNVLFNVPAMIKRLKNNTNAQKVSFVCLTDGESSPLFYHDTDGNWNGISMVTPYGKLLLRDGHNVYELALDMKWLVRSWTIYIRCPMYLSSHLSWRIQRCSRYKTDHQL